MKIIFLGWVKEVRTTKSYVCGAQREYVNTLFSIPYLVVYKAKDLSAPPHPPYIRVITLCFESSVSSFMITD
jgi:hypothetical protein